jgi:hypothetical protein
MPISRLFDTAAEAAEAVGALKDAGFREAGIHVFAPESTNLRVNSLLAAGVLPMNAGPYAAAIKGGSTLVVVETALGAGASAAAILDKGAGAQPGASHIHHEAAIWDDAAPFSSAFGLSVLCNCAAPCSAVIGVGPLSSKATPFSSALHLRVLSRGGSGYRSFLRLPTLLKSRRSSATVARLKNPWMLSSMIGIKMLSGNATPFSSMLGLPVLSRPRSAAAT